MTAAERMRRNQVNEELAEERRQRLRDYRIKTQATLKEWAAEDQAERLPEIQAAEEAQREAAHDEWLSAGEPYITSLAAKLKRIEARLTKMEKALRDAG